MLSIAFIVALASHVGAGLPPASYKASCPVQGANPLFIGQGVPGNFGLGHIEVAGDLHWLSLSGSNELVGYLITGRYSHQLVLVPYSKRPTFVNPHKSGNGSQFIPLGSVAPNSAAITRALYAQKLVLSGIGNERFVVHRCFSTVWDGTYPPGS